MLATICTLSSRVARTTTNLWAFLRCKNATVHCCCCFRKCLKKCYVNVAHVVRSVVLVFCYLYATMQDVQAINFDSLLILNQQSESAQRMDVKDMKYFKCLPAEASNSESINTLPPKCKTIRIVSPSLPLFYFYCLLLPFVLFALRLL